MSSTSLAIVVLVALVGLHTAWAGGVVSAACDDRNILGGPVCSGASDENTCNQAYSGRGQNLCTWDGSNCVEDFGNSCDSEFDNGVNCGSNVVASCNSQITLEDCVAARTATNACHWDAGSDFCAEMFACN